MSTRRGSGGAGSLSVVTLRPLTPPPARADDRNNASQRTRLVEPGTPDLPPSMPGEEGVMARRPYGAPRWLVGFLCLAGVLLGARPASGQG